MTKSVLLALALSSWAFAQPLLTEAERSGFQKTGRYSEVIDLCQQFQARWPGQVRALTYGQTPQGRPLQALVVNGAGLLDSAEVARRRVPVLLFQGGILTRELRASRMHLLILNDLLKSECLGREDELLVLPLELDGLLVRLGRDRLQRRVVRSESLYFFPCDLKDRN